MTSKIFQIVIVLFILTSCKEKESSNNKFGENGGMIIQLELNKLDSNSISKLTNRLETYATVESIEINTLKKENVLEIEFPVLLSNNDLIKLLSSEGKIQVRDEAGYFKQKMVKNYSFNLDVDGIKKVYINFKNTKTLEELSSKNLNKRIEFFVDGISISNPKVTKTIINGKIPFHNFPENTAILYSILQNPYQKPLVLDKIEKQFFIKKDNGIVEIPVTLFDNYNEIRNLLKNNIGVLYNISDRNFTESQKKQIVKKLNIVYDNSFDDFLSYYKFQKAEYLQHFFLELKNKYQNYKHQFDETKQEELAILIESLQKFTDNDIFELK